MKFFFSLPTGFVSLTFGPKYKIPKPGLCTNWQIQNCRHLYYLCTCAIFPLEILIIPICTCAGFVGMALSYGLSLNMSFVFSIQNQCQLANQIISVERVNQYMDIPSEAAETIEENRPSPDWPQAGRVELRDLKVTER